MDAVTSSPLPIDPGGLWRLQVKDGVERIVCGDTGNAGNVSPPFTACLPPPPRDLRPSVWECGNPRTPRNAGRRAHSQ